jgi:hypothetical protein
MNVFWANVTDDFQINSKLSVLWGEPVPLKKHLGETYNDFFKETDISQHLLLCPSVQEEIKNTYAVLSPIDLTLTWDGNQTQTNNYDQQFFDQMICIKRKIDGSESRFISINLHLIFFTEKKCTATVTPAYMSDTYFPKNSIMIAGQMDLNSWLRPIDVMIFRDINKSIIIKKGEPLYYIKFHTDEKVIFSRFNLTKELLSIVESCISVRRFTGAGSLSKIYEIFNKSMMRNRVVSLIKQNLF